MKALRIVAAGALCALALAARGHAGEGASFALVTLEGSVNPIVAEHVVDSIKKAPSQGASFVVLRIDTPGGLMGSMREIITAILGSEIPVIVFTAPKGAQAASAGGFIMLSAHVAAMAPATEIGAMHPVSPFIEFGEKEGQGKGGENIMGKKVLNDTVAYGRSIAQKRHRNVDWTERAIREAISSTYQEALNLNVIDLVAEDMDELLVKLDGRRVDMDGRTVTLSTKGARRIESVMDWKQRMLNFFADPQIVFFLFIIAVAGIGLEMKSPGMVLPGVLGVIALFLFLLAVRILPVNLAGLLLIIASIVLFILELKFASYGLLALGGIIAFIIGSMILFDSPLPGGQVPRATVAAVLVFLLVFFFGAIRAVIKTHRGKVTTGAEGLVGEAGRAMSDFPGTGRAFVHGEIWNARSDESIRRDEPVEVVAKEGMVLVVKKRA
jgi:membrane-bound serine protease (ClpP class)